MKNLITFCCLLIIKFSFAGIHITFTDYIIWEGDTLTLSNRPLDPYFDLYPELMPLPDKPFIHANNQYTAIFEIKKSSLYLTAIYTDKLDSTNARHPKNLISEVFNGKTELRMDWLSTTLVFGTSVLGGSKNIYGNQKNEKFFVALIDEGTVTSKRNLSANKLKKLRHRLFKEFSTTTTYITLQKKIFGIDNRTPKEFEKYLHNRIFDYTSRVNKEKTPHNIVYNA